MADVAHVVVVDDEPDLRATVQEYLLRHGYAVSAVADGAALRELLSRRPVDLAILDIALPGEDGLSLARFLRGQGPVGIIMLTASAATVDRVVGLEIGADDYVAKPFEPRELLARVRSVLRRAAAGPAPRAVLGREVRFGRCRLNLDTRKLYDATGGEVPITAMEFDLLEALARHPDRVLSRDRLLDLAHRKDAAPFDRSIDTRIARLRAKIEDDPAAPRAIRTVRGVGYVFVPAEG
jgi:two-component system phosphate regulon response regulator OmpR